MLRETDKLLPEGSSETFVQARGQGPTVTANQARAARAARRRTDVPRRGVDRDRRRPTRRARARRNSSSSASPSARPPR